MTELAITPNYEKKRLELAGTVAAGEHVAVTIVGGGAWIGTGKALRLRVICGARTVAKFPLWTEDNAEDWPEDVTSADAWDSANEGADATCVLNLNTVPAVKLLRFGGMCLWVLDDAENHTLYGSGEYIVEPWPKERGEDEPYYLDEYPDIVAELGERINAVEKSISDAVDEANGIVAYVTAARNDAQSAAQIAGTARNGAQTAQGKAEDAQTAAEAAQAAVEAALPLDATLAIQGKAADAKAVGDAIALKADKSTTYTKSETYTKIETTNAISSAIATVVDSAPEAFDTLKEIADWIEDDVSGAAAMAAAIKGKVDKVSGKGLSANDYTDADKEKLAGIAEGADVTPAPIAPSQFPANPDEEGKAADAYWTGWALSAKAEARSGTQGNIAVYAEYGTLLEDSGYKPSDFATHDDVASVASNVDTAQATADYAQSCANDAFTKAAEALSTANNKADASSLAPVATSGNYDDLRGRPGNVSAFANDAGYLTAHQSWSDVKPSGGITASDLAAAVQTSLGKADTALQAHQDISGKADKVANATSGNLAALDENGNLADSGKAIGDFALAESLAPKFATDNAYEVGDLCTSFDNDEQHKGTWLYKCILAPDPLQPPTPPEIDPTHWALATVEDVFAALRRTVEGKVDKEAGKGLSSNDYTNEDKGKLAGIEAGAQKNPDLSGYATKDAALPRYYSTSLEVVDGMVTVPPYTNAGMLSDGTAFTVAVGEDNIYMRDCILIVECGDVAPTITWPANFHPRTDAETDFACVAGATNVYWISEYVQGEFAVAGWQATAGGSAV